MRNLVARRERDAARKRELRKSESYRIKAYEGTKRWREAHPEAWRKIRVRTSYKCRYGITPEQFRQQVKIQNGKCACCGEPLKLGPDGLSSCYAVPDHDHDTKVFRGVLCQGCNVGIGHVEDAPWLEKALNYLTYVKAAGNFQFK